MSADWVTAIATAGTFVVIAASAVAALMQLRHMRSSNQIVALTELRETMESAAFREHFRELVGPFQERLADPAFRTKLLSARHVGPIAEVQGPIAIGNFFENAGVLIKHHIIDPDLFCDLWGENVLGAWSALEEFTANRRLITGPGLYENFEYLALLSERFIAKHPQGTFAASFARKQLPEPWPESAGYVKV